MAKKAKKEMNVFDQARETAKQEEQKPKGGKGRATLLIAGLKRLAAINTLLKALKGLKESSDAEVRGVAAEHFIEEGMKLGRQPDNFDAFEDNASANVQLRKRGTNSVINEETNAVLQKYGIVTEVIVERAQLYTVNPKYMDDQAKLKKVSDFLVKNGMDDFILMQTEVSRRVTTEQTITDTFQKVHDKDELRQVLPLVSELAIKVAEQDTREALMMILADLEKQSK